ncbi:hypothetical protein [Geodermatophilus marinus]|uniref:hypothetical protein n=1 Tax=Geodermatophilus sp. LHW52908 TaxID=2303986 RepID=UPI000E3C5D31|nr:hypothetical protein [Geodermatophilus sp. LHW52908]RFU19324.1 hypothetical protein D0Z06_21890 [Geodermatophilus sp. LHW52908]
MDTALRPVVPPLPALVRRSDGPSDAAQEFVTRLRAAGPDFAVAAGADTAVVREVVPPARHRRARCRVVLRFADGDERDVTLLGPVSRPTARGERAFDLQVQAYLAQSLGSDGPWLVPDDEAEDGVAVDVPAWTARAAAAALPEATAG